MAAPEVTVVERSWKRKLTYTSLVVILAIAAVLFAAHAKTPEHLPGVALGSKALLVAERAAAMFAIFFLAALIVVRALQGELPQELSGRGVKYARSDAVEELRTRLDGQLDGYEKSLSELEEAQSKLDERLKALEGA